MRRCCFRSSIPSPAPSTNVWTDDFTEFTGGSAPEYVWNGRWGDCLYRFSYTRTLNGNGDKQIWVNDTMGSGSTPIASVLKAHGGYGDPPYLRAQSDSSIKLRTYLITDAEAKANFWGSRYPSGCITDCKPPILSSGSNYGTWTIRFRINAFGKGQHLAIWLMSDVGEWPPEIDLLEVINGQDIWYANTHALSGGDANGMLQYNRPGGPNDWYVISFTLTPNQMTWRTNDIVVRSMPHTWPEKRYFLSVTWEIGTTWTGDPDATTPWPCEVEVDYVKFDSLS